MIIEETEKVTRPRAGFGPRIEGALPAAIMPVLTPIAAVVAGTGIRELGAVGGLAGVLVFVVLLTAVYGGEYW